MQLDGFVEFRTHICDQMESKLKMAVVAFVNLENIAKQEQIKKLRVAEASTNRYGAANLAKLVLAGPVIFVLKVQFNLVKTYVRLVISVH